MQLQEADVNYRLCLGQNIFSWGGSCILNSCEGGCKL